MRYNRRMGEEQNNSSEKQPTGETDLHKCLNCGESYTDRYCNHCGQAVTNPNITLRQLFKDFIAEYFTFDSRFARTLKLLIAKPGQATVEYNRGRHVHYAHPVKMYLFISFLAFLLFAPFLNVQETGKPSTSSQTEKNVLSSPSERDGDKTNSRNTKERSTEEASSMEIKISPEDIGLGNSVNKKLSKVTIDEIKNIQAKFNNYISQLMFFLMPLFALLLKLFYRRSDKLYAHHVVFSLHFHTFYFFLSSVLMALQFIVHDSIVSLVQLGWIPAYLFLSLRRVFNESKLRTFWKTLSILILYLIILIVIFFVLLISVLLML